MATTYIYKFRVQGFGYFPVDMFRYDRCWPDSGADSDSVERAMKPGAAKTTITLCGLRPPTTDQWESFFWPVDRTGLATGQDWISRHAA